MSRTDAFTLADPQWFKQEFSNGSEDPFGGAAPRWLEGGVPTYVPPTERTTLLGDWLNRSQYWADQNSWLNTLSWGQSISFALGFGDRYEESPADIAKGSIYDPGLDYDSLPEGTRRIFERNGFSREAVTKSVKTPGGFANWTADVTRKIEVQTDIEAMDSEAGFARYASTKLGSALFNVVGADPTNILTFGAGTVLKGAGFGVKSTTASILASGGGWGAVGGVDAFDAEVRWNIAHGVMDWEDVEALDYLGAAGTGTAMGLAIGAIPGYMHYRKFGWSGPSAAAVTQQGSTPPSHPMTAAMMGDYHASRLALKESLVERFGDDWRPFRFVLEPRAFGMTESEHLSFIRSLAKRVDEYRPTSDEFIGWLDPNGVRSKNDLDLGDYRLFRESVISQRLGQNANDQISRVVEARYGKNADKFSFLTDTEVTSRLGFTDQQHVLDWLQTAGSRDFNDVLRFRRPDERLLNLQGEYRQSYDRLVKTIEKADRRKLGSKKIETDVPAFRGEDISVRIVSRERGIRLTPEQRRQAFKQPFSGGPEMVGNRIPDLTPERVPNITATRAVEALDVAMRQKETLESQIHNLKRVIDSDNTLLNRTGLKKILSVKEGKLAEVAARIEKAERKRVREANLGFNRPNASPALARQADAIRRKMSQLDPVRDADRIADLQKRIRNIEIRQTISPRQAINNPSTSRSAVGIQTKFIQSVNRLESLRNQVKSLSSVMESDPAAFTKTQSKILNDLNAQIGKLKKQIQREFSYDPDSKASIRSRPSRTASAASGAEEATQTPLSISDAVARRIDDLERNGDDWAVQRGMTLLNDIGNLPVARLLTNLARRAMFSRTGQIKTLFNGLFEEIRYLSQMADNTHIRNIDTKRGTSLPSIWLVKSRVMRKYESLVTAPVRALATKLGTDIAEANSAVLRVLRGGTDSRPEVNAVADGIRQMTNRVGEDGVKYGVFTNLLKDFVPRVHRASVVNSPNAGFVDKLTAVLVRKWSAKTDINRSVALDLGWFANTADGMVVTEAGQRVGITEAMPEVSGLTPSGQAAYSRQLEKTMRRVSQDAKARMTGSEQVVMDEMNQPQVLTANGRTIATKQRMFDDDVFDAPELQEFWETDLATIYHHYMSNTGLRVAVAKRLNEEFGVNMTLKDLLNETKKRVYAKVKEINDPRVQRDTEEAFAVIENKFDTILGNRPSAHTNAALSPHLLEIGMNVARTGYGGRWGAMSLHQEHLGQLFRARSSKEFGRSVANAIASLFTKSDDKTRILADVGFATELYEHSVRHAMSSSLDEVASELTWWERVASSYKKVAKIYRGDEIVPDTAGGGGVGRIVDTAKALTNATATTTVELGGLRFFTGAARVSRIMNVQGRLIDDLDKLKQVVKRLESIDVNSMGPRERNAMWRRLAADNGLDPDDLIQMNARRLLDNEFLDLMSQARGELSLDRRGGRWYLDEIRFADEKTQQRWERRYDDFADYLVEAVDEAVVNPRPFLRNTDAMHWTDFMLNEMQSYARAFGSGLAYRAVNQMSIPKMVRIMVGFAFGEALAKTLLGVAEGRMTTEEAQRRWTEESDTMAYRTITGIPFLGVWTGVGMEALGAISAATKGERTGRPPQLFGSTPMTSLFQQFSSGSISTYDDLINGEEIDGNKVAPFLNLIPGWGAWWFQAGLTGAGLNPRTPKE